MTARRVRYVLMTVTLLALSCKGDGPSAPTINVEHPPETLPVTIVVGDTVTGEALDSLNDIDEFTFVAQAGTELDLFFQASSGMSNAFLDAFVLDTLGNVLAVVSSVGSDQTLNQASGRFLVTTRGVYIVRISGADMYGSSSVGAYRFWLYPVNHKPEKKPQAIAFCYSIEGETTENTADIDEYRITVPAPSAANLVVQLAAQAEGAILLARLVTGGGDTVAAMQANGPGNDAQSSRITVSAGTYTLRIAGDGVTPLRGPYTVRMYAFSLRPESVRDTLVIGDTVGAELINPPGDQDTYWFFGVRRQHANIKIQGRAAATSNGGFRAFLLGPATPPDFLPVALVSVPTASGGTAHQSLRLDLPRTGWYHLDVTGASTPEQLSEIGNYKLTLASWDTVPEIAPSSLAVGDSIGETIDPPGDWDQFTVTGTPGEELGLLIHSDGSYPFYPSILLFNAASSDSMTTVGQDTRFLGPFRVPANGRLTMAVFERPMVFFRECYDEYCGSAYRLVSSYDVRLFRINRAPESIGAAYVVGDTAGGEAIDEPGDLDEYTSSGTPGAVLTPFFRMTGPPEPPGSYGLELEIVDPATGGVLVGSGQQVFGQTFVQYQAFTVPTSGNFVIRVRGTGLFGEDLNTGPYEFFIKP